MKRINSRTISALALALAGILAIGPAMADKDKHGDGKDKHGYKHEKQSGKHGDDDHGGSRSGDRYDDHRGAHHDDDDDDHHDRDDGHHDHDDEGWSRTGDRRHYFEDRHRVIVHEYYVTKGCPPGLAKKHNGCRPPGHARTWRVGQPLPPNVVYYEVPQPLVVQFGQPPSGYRYVRVASDILLMAVGTGMIMDAIQDLGSM